MASSSQLVAMIVDEDTATGMLLTGIGHSDMKKTTNFLIVTDSTSTTVFGCSLGSCPGGFWGFTFTPRLM
jgi:hypothetical protein